MKRLYIIILFAYLIGLAVSVAQYAANEEYKYVTIVREDRVWEYIRYNHDLFDPIYTVERLRVRFDGTQEKDGVLYHNLVFDGGERQCYYGMYQDEKDWIWGFEDFESENMEIISESPYWLPALIREENGVVYRCLSEQEREYFDVDHYRYQDMTELITLNFNLNNIGDSYEFEALQYYMCWWPSRISKLCLTDVSYIEIAGENCRSYSVNIYPQYLCPDNPDLHLIEGIGLVDKYNSTGTISHVGFSMFLTGSTLKSTSYYLNNVYDLDGNVIFEGVNWNPDTGVFLPSAESMTLEHIDKKITATAAFGGVSVSIYDINGRQAANLSGEREVSIDTSSLPKGIYIAKATASGRTRNLKFCIGN